MPVENDLRIVEVTDALTATKRYDLQQFKRPEKAEPDHPDMPLNWVRLTSFHAFDEASAALKFIRDNNATTTQRVIPL